MASKREERIENEASVMDYLLERAASEKNTYDETRNKRATVALARDGLVMEEIHHLLSSVFRNKLKPAGYSLKTKKGPKKRILNVALSDLHYHSLLDPRELPLVYGPLEEARRTAKIALETVEYKTQYRDETELFVHIFGDIIQGDLHDPRDAATMAMQFGAAVHYLTQVLHFASVHFPNVTARCVPGNHGRNKRRHHERATTQKWDSWENAIYLSVKYAVASLPNVTVDIPYTPYYTYKAFDKKGFITHGDTVLDGGFPSSTIDIKKIRNQVNEINAATKEDYDLFMIGHVHTGSMTHIPTGPVFLTNGALIPPDGYAVSRGNLKANCGQWLWESVPGFIVGDARFLNVNELTDKDSKLDGIITPFAGFETNSPLKKTR